MAVFVAAVVYYITHLQHVIARTGEIEVGVLHRHGCPRCVFIMPKSYAEKKTVAQIHGRYKLMKAVAEKREESRERVSTRFSPRVWRINRRRGTERPNLSRETKFLGANGDRVKKNIFRVEL